MSPGATAAKESAPAYRPLLSPCLRKDDHFNCAVSGIKEQCNLKLGECNVINVTCMGPGGMVLILLLVMIGNTKEIRSTTN